MARQISSYRYDQMLTQIDLHEQFEELAKGMDEANRNFVNQMARETVKIAKHRVGVKTGRTKRSIRIGCDAKYSRAGVIVDTWLIPWVENGSGYNFSRSGELGREKGSRREYRQFFHTQQNKRGKIKKKFMLKSHPAYYLLRPAKQLMGSIKSLKVYERNINNILRQMRIDEEV